MVHDAARSVSDPASPRFRRFVRSEDIAGWLSPSAEHRALAEATVAQWGADAATDACAAQAGAPCDLRVTWHDDRVSVRGTAAAFHHATGARLHAYQHATRPSVRRNALVGSLRVAAGAERAIELVTGASMLLDPSMLRTPTRERTLSPRAAGQEGEAAGKTVPAGQTRVTATGSLKCYDNAAGVAPSECGADQTCFSNLTSHSPAPRVDVACCPKGTVGPGGVCRPGGHNYSEHDPATAQYVVPRVVREAMHVPHAHATQTPPEKAPVTMGIAAFNDFFSRESLAKGMGLLDETPAENIMFMCRDLDNIDSMINGVDQFDNCGLCTIASPPCDEFESTLDVQYIQSTGTGIPMWFWMMGAQDWVLNWANTVKDALGNPEQFAWAIPRVFSISYGSAEQVLPEDYIPRSETALAALVAQGITVSVSSGDGGAVGQLPYKKYKVLIPSYPATSAYTTAVGATQLTSYAGSECGALNVLAGTCVGERVSSTSTSALITSGGGYSTVVKPLSYMKDAVATYARRAHNLPPSAAYNAEGRAYPDVAALGHNFLIVYGSDSVPFFLPVDGTSASSPVFAGVVALVAANAHAVDGVTGLGDIKPLLYSDEALTSGVFGDVTMGDNSCGRYDPNITSPCAGPGFDAVAGWDPATGLGTVRFPALRSLLVRYSSSASPSGGGADKGTVATAALVLGIFAFVLSAVALGLMYRQSRRTTNERPEGLTYVSMGNKRG